MTEQSTSQTMGGKSTLTVKPQTEEGASKVPAKNEALYKMIKDIVMAIAAAFIAYIGSYTYNAQEERNLMYKAEENRHIEATSRISGGCLEERTVIVEKSK